MGDGVKVGQGTLSNVVLNPNSGLKQLTDGYDPKTPTHCNDVPIGSSLSISK